MSMRPSALYQPYDVTGHTVLITGASSGFGEAMAWRFAELKCKLVLVARRSDRLDALTAQLKEAYGAELQVHTVTLDVRDTAACEALPAQLPAGFQEIDILINNAGLALGLSPAHENNVEDMRTMFETNVLAVMALTKAFVPGMLARGRGHVVNIGSTAGHEAYAGGSGYCATKFALNAYTTAARHDLVGTPVRVTLISPGAAETEFSVVRFKGDTDRASKVYANFVAMTAADIADNVVYAVTRPAHVQLNDIVVTSVHQSGAHYKYTAPAAK